MKIHKKISISKKLYSLFPQFSRIISAKQFRVFSLSLIWIVLLLTIFINILARYYSPTLVLDYALYVLKNPQDKKGHEDLASIYFDHKLNEKGKEELKLHQQNIDKQLVLGATTNAIDKQQKEKERNTKTITYWREIISKYPNYRDGYMQLGLTYLISDDIEKAREAFNKALTLDPTMKDAVTDLLLQYPENK